MTDLTPFIVVFVIGGIIAIGGAIYDHRKESKRGVWALTAYMVVAVSVLIGLKQFAGFFVDV